jgi:hypothetical protein
MARLLWQLSRLAYLLGDYLWDVPRMHRLGRAIVMSGATDRYMFLGPNETWRMKRREHPEDEEEDRARGWLDA